MLLRKFTLSVLGAFLLSSSAHSAEPDLTDINILIRRTQKFINEKRPLPGMGQTDTYERLFRRFRKKEIPSTYRGVPEKENIQAGIMMCQLSRRAPEGRRKADSEIAVQRANLLLDNWHDGIEPRYKSYLHTQIGKNHCKLLELSADAEKLYHQEKAVENFMQAYAKGKHSKMNLYFAAEILKGYHAPGNDRADLENAEEYLLAFLEERNKTKVGPSSSAKAEPVALESHDALKAEGVSQASLEPFTTDSARSDAHRKSAIRLLGEVRTQKRNLPKLAAAHSTTASDSEDEDEEEDDDVKDRVPPRSAAAVSTTQSFQSLSGRRLLSASLMLSPGGDPLPPPPPSVMTTSPASTDSPSSGTSGMFRFDSPASVRYTTDEGGDDGEPEDETMGAPISSSSDDSDDDSGDDSDSKKASAAAAPKKTVSRKPVRRPEAMEQLAIDYTLHRSKYKSDADFFRDFAPGVPESTARLNAIPKYKEKEAARKKAAADKRKATASATVVDAPEVSEPEVKGDQAANHKKRGAPGVGSSTPSVSKDKERQRKNRRVKGSNPDESGPA